MSTQRVAITGGARGIGRATAEACLRAGMSVVIGDLDGATVAAVVAELGERAVGLPLDVRDPHRFEEFLVAAARLWGQLRRHQTCRRRIHPSDSRRTRGTGVRTTIVMPGLIRTDMISGFEKPRATRIIGPEAVADAIVEAIRIGRGKSSSRGNSGRSRAWSQAPRRPSRTQLSAY